MSSKGLCIDVAGGQTGGAARYRLELLRYLEGTDRPRVRVVGAGRQLTPAWLVQREALAGKADRLAINNVCFSGPGHKTVLLVNALQFLRPAERPEYSKKVKGMATQSRVVHLACRRADLIVTPTSDMAERVATLLPGVAARIRVRAHPLTFRSTHLPLKGAPPTRFILSPALPAAHKDSGTHLRRISAALDVLGRQEVVAVTATGVQLPPDLAADPRIWPIGPQRTEDMPNWYAHCSAVYFPTSVESYGYPLAEARVSGRPVIAIDSAQNREVAGRALSGYAGDSGCTLESAIVDALDRPQSDGATPDPAIFDSVSYFNWLLAAAA